MEGDIAIQKDGLRLWLRFLRRNRDLMLVTKMCVCEACRLSIRNSMKARDDGEPFQLRWLKDKSATVLCTLL